MGVARTLPTGTDLTIALSTLAYHAGDGNKESWTAKFTDGAPVFVFDLTGSATDTSVGSIILWQYGNWASSVAKAGQNDFQDFEVFLHTNAEGDVFDFGSETPDLSDTAVRMQNRDTNGNVAQFFGFSGVEDARYVALRPTSNFGGDRYGLGEVRFADVTVVPEPSSAALLGLAGLALILRRRK